MAETRPMRRLRVAVVTPLGVGGRGGIDRLMDELRPLLAKEEASGIHVRFLVSRGSGSIVFSPFHLARAVTIIVRDGLLRRVDVVHINLSQDGSAYRKLIIAWVCRRLKLPYVLHLHGSNFHTFWDSAGRRLSRALTTMFACSAMTVVLGTVWLNFVMRKAPALASRIVILPTAARDPGQRRTQQSGKPRRIFFSGQHGPRKGTRELIGALNRLKCDPSWSATMTGNGAIDQTREAAKSAGIADRVTIPGWIPSSQFEALLDEADILVLPSHDENLPLSVVEAFARGIAVIATPVGALPDIIKDEQTGLLVPAGDVAALAAGIERLLHDDVLRARLGSAGRSVYEERLTLPAYARRLAETWRQAQHNFADEAAR
ncbi:MAG: glycosyltransferase family 4 protein [Alphaproteobacteria bacterium]|nr:glycosyltransferase family 4 protein [Alphaproteobacteria bacterium]MDE2012315.1 glycosyltransferase family 4 protein [Alphaproteobacteria bacterium]MDE2072988.1 glycosyltransferase family 4 protein [Alphaproteobacteria bacterium]MDE2352079.1 glycosyltransferase family 4 protein [Alphaproteobacteria bacterium]